MKTLSRWSHDYLTMVSRRCAMKGKKVKIKITETFTKQVEVTVPRMLNTDALIVRWVREHVDNRIIDATNMDGVVDAGDDMDYDKKMEVVNGGDATK